MKHLFIYAGLLLLSLQACNNIDKKKPKEIVDIPAGDAKFLAFKDTAQTYINQFIDSLKQHGEDEKHYIFIVKSDFIDKEDHEHMWSRVFALEDGKFHGMLTDSPYTVKNIKMRDEVKILPGDIEDWVIYDENYNQKAGGFSIEYLKSKRVE